MQPSAVYTVNHTVRQLDTIYKTDDVTHHVRYIDID